MQKPKLIATSVVRGSQQGESHGGVYTIDFESQLVEQHIEVILYPAERPNYSVFSDWTANITEGTSNLYLDSEA